MLAVIVGLIFAVFGLWGVVIWWPDFITVVKGSIPFMLIIGGLIAVVAGITGIVEAVEEKNPVKDEEIKPGEESKQ